MTNNDTILGPYFDVNKRTDELTSDRDSCARLCAKKLLMDHTESARWWAEQYAAADAELTRVLEYAMARRRSEDPGRFVGMHHHRYA